MPLLAMNTAQPAVVWCISAISLVGFRCDELDISLSFFCIPNIFLLTSTSEFLKFSTDLAWSYLLSELSRGDLSNVMAG